MSVQPPGAAESHPAYREKIELLPIELLDQNRSLVNELKRVARSLDLEFGWHYLLDLTWILSQIGPLAGARILDAGAGTGVLQWYLAQQGARVISVDRLSRAALPLRFRARVRVQGLRPTDLLPSGQVFKTNWSRSEKGPFYRELPVKLISQVQDALYLVRQPKGPGQVIIYNQDLSELADIPDNSLDAVVAVSALEHNSPQGLEGVVKESLRVLKPGSPLLATLCAARDQDWWHEASSGWCYSDRSLRRLFDLPPDLTTNYDRYDEFFTALRDCAELRDNLARFYFQSDKNGMPWGVWDPQYQPVGVCKVK